GVEVETRDHRTSRGYRCHGERDGADHMAPLHTPHRRAPVSPRATEPPAVETMPTWTGSVAARRAGRAVTRSTVAVTSAAAPTTKPAVLAAPRGFASRTASTPSLIQNFPLHTSATTPFFASTSPPRTAPVTTPATP